MHQIATFPQKNPTSIFSGEGQYPSQTPMQYGRDTPFQTPSVMVFTYTHHHPQHISDYTTVCDCIIYVVVDVVVLVGGGTLPYYNPGGGSPAYLSYLSLLTNAAAAAAAAAGSSVYQPPSQLVPGSPFPSPSSAGCCTPASRLDVSPPFDFSSPFHPASTQRLHDLQKGMPVCCIT